MNRLQVETNIIRNTRTARRIEQALRKKTGINVASVSASGVVRVEWDTDQTSQSEILR
ncbi:hypothetical protein [Robiginitalea sp.]|uniref:hypothetical protein n=1 Tax=Robiginitalea sp. TaxID=1902411 RepID=UPI003C744481